MADIYGTICLMEKDILAAFREFTRKNVSLRERKRIRNSRKIKKGAFDLFEIIKGVLERIKQNSKPEWTGKKEALESLADRMLRIFKILNERRHRRQLNNVIFFESKTAFKRRARTAVVEFIKKKHAVVNIECGGNQCFAHSVMARLYPAKNGSSSQNKLHSYPHWKNKEMGLKLREEDFPISYADIPQFEKDNDISINVYEVDEQEETIYGSYRTTKKRTRHVNLLLLEDEDGGHY
ncbi:hypothetical protein QAD02_002619 [Eretmocerus hayati]|uniref:Uncharacterized protein n=1 Tax=Eretmocerus hayati TaxID=131215 RepID=A0ACC2NJJ3_9HYME|nr:hypothetical protein QAD02_002619 [Eretmocerus hayati]